MDRSGPSSETTTQAEDRPLFKKRTTRPRPKVRASEGPDPPSACEEGSDEPGLAVASIEELIALRRLRKAKGGIDLEKLNAGEKKRKKKTKTKEEDQSQSGAYGLQDVDPELDGDEAKTRKLVKSNNFTGQTNALDVDKHMMAYIESELKKRREADIAAGRDPGEVLSGSAAIASLDPRDELYRIAEKHKIAEKPVIEGNVTLSASMLTSIPEVDLGIDTRLRNIEETEKAKRRLAEAEAIAASAMTVDPTLREHFAADRFFLPNQQWSTDEEALRIARLESEGLTAEAEALRREVRKAQQSKLGSVVAQAARAVPGVHGSQVASDDRAVDNFKKRMANRK